MIELFSSLSIFVGIYAGIHLSDWFTQWLRNSMKVQSTYAPLFSFLAILVIVIIGLWLLARLITKTVKAGGAERWNQIGGSFFAVCKTVLSISVLFLIFHSIDTKASIIPQSQKDKSYFYQPIYRFSLIILPSIKDSEFYRQYIPHPTEEQTEKERESPK